MPNWNECPSWIDHQWRWFWECNKTVYCGGVELQASECSTMSFFPWMLPWHPCTLIKNNAPKHAPWGGINLLFFQWFMDVHKHFCALVNHHREKNLLEYQSHFEIKVSDLELHIEEEIWMKGNSEAFLLGICIYLSSSMRFIQISYSLLCFNGFFLMMGSALRLYFDHTHGRKMS